MAKNVANRVVSDVQEMWNENKGDASWRSAYDKFRAKGLSFARAVEEASRKSPGGGAGDVQTTATGKKRRPKRAGAKPVIAGGGEGGQGKVKRGSKMRKATAKGDNSRIGQVAIKRAWAAARKSAGESRWAIMTKEQKTEATLRRVGPMTGEEAIGAVRALGSRVLTLNGSNEGVNEIITDWAKGQGVKAPATELKIGAKGKAEGKTGKETARAGGKGAEAPAGPEKPALGKKAKRIVKRRGRLDEILREGEDADSRTRRRAQKPTPDPDAVVGESEDERKNRLAKVREEDAEFKNKYTTAYEDEEGNVRRIPKPDALPKGVKRRSVSIDVQSGAVKEGKNAIGEKTTTPILKPRKFSLLMKGDTVYVGSADGRTWKTMSLDDYKSQLGEGKDPGSPTGKPKRLPSTKQEFGKKMEAVSVQGKSLNAEYITESAAQAFMDANRKISEKNKIAIGKGVPTEKLAPRYKVADFVDAAYPNLGQAERSSLIRGIRKSFRGERKARKAAKAAKAGQVTELRPETVEEGRKKLNAKDVRIAKGKAAPLEKVKLESKAEGRRRGRRVKTVGQTLSAVMDPSKATPSAESMEPAPKKAKRIFTPKAPGSELEMEMSKLRDSLNPDEKRTFKKIKEVARLGFTKAQVKERAVAGAFGKITPKVRKIAKAGGYLGLVATALQFLEAPKTGKK